MRGIAASHITFDANRQPGTVAGRGLRPRARDSPP